MPCIALKLCSGQKKTDGRVNHYMPPFEGIKRKESENILPRIPSFCTKSLNQNGFVFFGQTILPIYHKFDGRILCQFGTIAFEFLSLIIKHKSMLQYLQIF